MNIEDLIKAAAKADAHHLVTLLTDCENVDALGENGLNALHVAARKGDSNCVKLLLQAGASPHVKDVFKRTPLHWAAGSNDVEKTDLLLSSAPDCLVEQDENNETPMMSAFAWCKKDTALFLGQKADVEQIRNAAFRLGYHPTMDPTETIKHLLKYLEATKKEVFMEFLIDGLCQSRGWSDATFQALIVSKAKPTIRNLHSAIKNNKASVLNLYFANQGSPSADMGEGENLFHLVARKGDIDLTKVLIKNGVDMEARNHKGETPLMLACSKDSEASLEYVKFLVENGASLLALDSEEVGSGERLKLKMAEMYFDEDDCDSGNENPEQYKGMLKEALKMETVSKEGKRLDMEAKQGRAPDVKPRL